MLPQKVETPVNVYTNKGDKAEEKLLCLKRKQERARVEDSSESIWYAAGYQLVGVLDGFLKVLI